MRKPANGYTLVETIVSVAVIGIVTACVVSALLGKSQSVEASRAGQDEVVSLNQPTSEMPVLSAIENINQYDNSTLEGSQIQARATCASRHMELRIIQTAVDIMMIREGINQVNPTGASSDMTDFPAGSPLYPRYVRESNTQYRYCCDRYGEVTLSED